MTLQELIELAILDAMGLLDEDERELFESAFRAAAPAVQAQVRREQTRLSQIDMLLPDVVPPAGLRARVIQAVREEMARTSTPNLVVPTIVRSSRVSPLWRAGSLGLAAAVLILTVTLFIFQSQHQRALQQLGVDGIIGALGNEMGPAFVRDVLFNRDTERVVFISSEPGFRGEASVFVNPEWAQAKFFCNGMPSTDGRTYRLAIIDDNDEVVETLATFSSEGGLLSRDVAIRPGATGQLAIIGFTENAPSQILSRAKLQG